MTVRRTICVAGAFAAALLLTSTAAAAGRENAGERLLFHLRAANGYKIYGIGEGATGALVVTRGRQPHRPGVAASVYIARARTGRSRLETAFGRLGRVDLRFQPSGRVTYGKRHRHCRGPDRYATHYGVFRGTVRFRGEGAYTAVHRRSLEGKVVTPAALHCFGVIGPRSRSRIWDALRAPLSLNLAEPSSSPLISEEALRTPPRLPHLLNGPGRRTLLSAHWHLATAAQAFGAQQRGHRRPVFFAGTLQTQERLAVVRLAATIGSPADLLASDSLAAAIVIPPAPFNGEASFRHLDDGTKIWAGSLAVSFPGAPDVPLTGPQFEIGLSRGF